MKKRRIGAMLLCSVSVAMMAGCGASEKSAPATSAPSQSAAVQTETSAQAAETSAQAAETESQELPDVEVWSTNTGFKEVKQGGPTYEFYKELTGVGLWQPYVEWNSGSTYQEQLNLRISAGEMPDIIQCVNGLELDLIKNGAVLDLTDLLPEKAPHLWNAIPEDVWNVMRACDPTGEGRIYMVPNVVEYPQLGAIIRQDWLDKLGLEMPTTQEEFVEVLRAFKTQDPNGNGIADEIPTGGREGAVWMDHLFNMYGIAMRGGEPLWDVYDGELTYSAVTPNMRDALIFINSLYEEGLMDPETLLNDKTTWDGKIDSDKVGVYFHWVQYTHEHALANYNATGVKPDWRVMPAISAPGYEGGYVERKVNGIQWIVKNTDDPLKIEAYMKALDAYGNEEIRNDFYFGAEGMHHDVVDGVKVKRPDDKATQENLLFTPYQNIVTVESYTDTLESISSEETKWAVDGSIANLQNNVENGHHIAGDGIPASIFDGYPDLVSRTMYSEYVSKIITGEWPIEKFDEFVEKWYASGGTEVTNRAREWYAQVAK